MHDIAIRAGLPYSAGHTINRFCSSGLQAIALGIHSYGRGQMLWLRAA